MHSEKYELVKKYYEDKKWSKTAVRNAVKRGYITKSEYQEITSEEY